LAYQGYEINGYTFYTRSQDKKRTNQNSGVRIEAIDTNSQSNSYFGYIKEIWELDYGPLKIPLFRCQWVKLTGKGIDIDAYGMTTIELKELGYRDKRFVLAKDVTQVLYMKDMSSKPKKDKSSKSTKHKSEDDDPKHHIVLVDKRKLVGVDDVMDEEEYNKAEDMTPFAMDVDTSILFAQEDALYIRHDHNVGTIVKKTNVNISLSN
jgi:hypothetical protein